MFKVNEGPIDRAIRVTIGIIGISLGLFVFSGVLKIIALIVGVAGLLTGVLGFCGLYMLLGINTCPVKKTDNEQKQTTN